MQPIALYDLMSSVDTLGYTGPEPLPIVSGVCIDSRRVKQGDLFFALKGERSDGHRYVRHALEAGAAAAVVSKQLDVAQNGPIVLVEDVLQLLLQQALGSGPIL